MELMRWLSMSQVPSYAMNLESGDFDEAWSAMHVVLCDKKRHISRHILRDAHWSELHCTVDSVDLVRIGVTVLHMLRLK